AAAEPFHQAGLPVIHLDSPEVDKDATARQIARERGIQEGLVCTLGSVEMHASFEHRRTIMVRRKRPCHVLYQYQYHPQVGWMYARIQTWFPFRIQVGLNGREWLAQQMRRENLKFRQADNCLVWIEDYARAQALMNQQVQTHWAELLGGLARQLNPLHESIFANIRWTTTGPVSRANGPATWCSGERSFCGGYAAAGASRHAEFPQPGRDAVLGQEGEPVGGRAGKLSRGPADGPEAATGRGAGQVLHERELGEILRQGLQ